MRRTAALILLVLPNVAACVHYNGVAKVGRNVYLTGTTSHLFYSTSWVKRCLEDGGKLQCEEMSVEDVEGLPDARDGRSDVTRPAAPEFCFTVDDGDSKCFATFGRCAAERASFVGQDPSGCTER